MEGADCGLRGNLRDGRGVSGWALLSGDVVLHYGESSGAGDGAGVAEEEEELAVLLVGGEGDHEGGLGPDVNFHRVGVAVVEVLNAPARSRAIGPAGEGVELDSCAGHLDVDSIDQARVARNGTRDGQGRRVVGVGVIVVVGIVAGDGVKLGEDVVK